MCDLEKIKVVFNKAVLEDLDGNKMTTVDTISSNPTSKPVLSEEEAQIAQTQSHVGVSSVLFAIVTGFLIVFLLGTNKIYTLVPYI